MTAANARKLQSWQALHDFFSKHALGSKLPPSCLCCGQSMQDREIGVQHMELPDIVVCLQCRDRGQAQPAEAVDGAREVKRMQELPMPKIDVYALAFSVSNSLPVRAYQEDLDEFARLILEEAAKACDEKVALANPEAEFDLGYSSACVDCAAAIRALKP